MPIAPDAAVDSFAQAWKQVHGKDIDPSAPPTLDQLTAVFHELSTESALLATADILDTLSGELRTLMIWGAGKSLQGKLPDRGASMLADLMHRSLRINQTSAALLPTIPSNSKPRANMQNTAKAVEIYFALKHQLGLERTPDPATALPTQP